MEINQAAKEPMFIGASEHVFIRAFLDTRRMKENGTYPIYIRVTYQGEKMALCDRRLPHTKRIRKSHLT